MNFFKAISGKTLFLDKIYRKLFKFRALFEIETVFLLTIGLLFCALSCLVLSSHNLVLSSLLWSWVALMTIPFLRGFGFYTALIGLLASNLYYWTQQDVIFAKIWLVGCLCSIIISWFIYWLGLTVLKDSSIEHQQKYDSLSDEYDRFKCLYQNIEQEKIDLLASLKETQSLLSSSLKDKEDIENKYRLKHEELARDLDILVEQKDYWARDYASLHKEYMSIISQNQDIIPIFHTNDNLGIVDLQKDIAEKNSLLEQLNNKITTLNLQLSDHDLLKEDFQKLLEEKESAFIQVRSLQDSLSVKNLELANLKAEIRELQSKVKVSSTEDITVSKNLKEEHSYKSKYLQLRQQFIEKNEALLEIRKELFRVQEELLRYQKKEDVDNVIIDLKEIELMRDLLDQIEHLEEEVNYLEGLISHSLHQ